jgi:hypothetical protein
MAKTRLLVISVVIIMLLLMTVPVSAVVKPPVTVKDALLKGIWGAIMDLQNQIDALTKRVDAIQTSPMPEYRAGTYTTPPPLEDPGIFPDTQTVTFSHPMLNTNYRVSITNTNTGGFFYPPTAQCQNQMCIFTIDSKTTTGFTFSIRSPLYGTIYRIDHSRTFDYIAIADN